MVNGRTVPPPPLDAKVQTSHVREMAANLLLGRALHTLDAAGGVVRYRDVDGRWNRDQLVLPQRPDRLAELGPLLDALVEWALHSEQPAVIGDLAKSRWSRHLLHGGDPPNGSAAAVPLAQRGAIWGALAVYRAQRAPDAMELRRKLAELATEPLSSLDSSRPEGVG
jgi:GAF domain-containing protein